MNELDKGESLIVSKERVNKFGEVYTPKFLVDEMMKEIPQVVYDDIDATWLEPSCGNGNFLVAILERKLELAAKLCKEDYDINFLKCVTTVYGIDIQLDNVEESRQRMLDMLKEAYIEQTGLELKNGLLKSVKYCLSVNIACGDFLTLKFIESGVDLTSSEWIFVEGKVTRRDYLYKELLSGNSITYRITEYSPQTIKSLVDAEIVAANKEIGNKGWVLELKPKKKKKK